MGSFDIKVTSNLGAVAEKLKAKLPSGQMWIVQIGAKATTPSEQPPLRLDGQQAIQSKPRSAKQNAIISNTHAKRGRNYKFLSDSEAAEISKMWVSAINKIWRSGYNNLVADGLAISNKIIEYFKSHILGEMTADGKMKPLKEPYGGDKGIKSNRWKSPRPILVASYQLFESMIPGFKVK